MPIKVACKCGQKFTAKDELAGKAVKCPKCGAGLRIPGGASAPAGPKPAAQRPAAKKPPVKKAPAKRPPAPTGGGLDDLLADAGIGGGMGPSPECPQCKAPMSLQAVLCISCGFNRQTGHKTAAAAGVDLSERAMAEAMVRKAQKEIDANPDAKQNETDFGDAGSIWTWVLLIFMPFFFVVAVGVTIFWGLQLVVAQAGIWGAVMSGQPGAMWVAIGLLFYFCAALTTATGWFLLTMRSLEQNIYHGFAVLLTCGIYAFFYGMISWKENKGAATIFYTGGCIGQFGAAVIMTYQISTMENNLYTTIWIVWLWFSLFSGLAMFISYIWTTVAAWEVEWFHGFIAMLAGMWGPNNVWGTVICFMNFKQQKAPAIMSVVAYAMALISLIWFFVLVVAGPLARMPSGYMTFE